MTSWVTKNLDELCVIKGGKRLPKGHDLTTEKTLHPYIRARDIGDGIITFNNPQYLTDETFRLIKNYIVNYEDVVITIVGANIGDIAFVEQEFDKANLTENAVKLISRRNLIEPKFLKYSLLRPHMKEYFQVVSSGAAQGKLGLYKIKQIKILVPPLSIQKKITSILSAYDNLIENNLKRIKLLEELAQRTYEEWFVKFRINGERLEINKENMLPEGWEKVSMSGIANFLNGFAFKPSDWSDLGLPIIKIKELKAGIGNDTPRNDGSRVPNRYLVTGGDILFSWSGSLEVVIWQGEDGWLNQHLFKVKPIIGIPREFVHQALLFALAEFNSLTTGATMKHIKRQELDFVKISVPQERILKEFKKCINPVQEQILNLSKQNRLLKETRDILLPRLMNGTINVEKLDSSESMRLAAEPKVGYKTKRKKV